MDCVLEKYMKQFLERYPQLNTISADIEKTYLLLKQCYSNGNKLLIAGNGGSAADAQHIVGELMKGFCNERSVSQEFAMELKGVSSTLGEELAKDLQRPLPAIALDCHNALSTAYSNDVDAAKVYAQQIFGYGNEGDVFLGISTSGNSKNILYAAVVAKAKKMKVIGLTGCDGGKLANLSDIVVKVPEKETYKIQELHLPIYHLWCLMLEKHFFG